MSYEHDVFLSYPRQSVIAEWVSESFLPLFKPYLSNELGRQSSTFFDLEYLRPGDAWPDRLEQALARSRCMVTVWTVSYFQSAWCQTEMQVMLRREKQAGPKGEEDPTRLIYPIRAHDGEHFPPFARNYRQADFRNYVLALPGFKRTQRYVEFQEAVAAFASEVALGINRAPEWNPSWLQARPDDVTVLKRDAFELPRLI